MSKFKYFRPELLTEAFKLMANNQGYYLIAGGTDLMVKLKEKLIKPKAVIDLGALPELKGIVLQDNQIRVGAYVNHTELAESGIIKQFAPALAKAAGLVGSPQIRNKGTVGGNMGNASPAADTVPALMAYEAEINIASINGIKKIPLKDLFNGPGHTILAPGEIITEICFKAQQANQGSSFQKLGKRNAQAISVVNAAVSVAVDPQTKMVTTATLALGSVAATPIRVTEAEMLMTGKVVSDELIDKTAQTVKEVIKPIDDVRSTAVYRKESAGVLIKRALEEVWSQVS